jgi:hypothetical protein
VTKILPATEANAREIFHRLREEDQFEINCLGLDPDAAMRAVLAGSDAWVGLAGDKVACVFGALPQDGLAPARVWLLTTPLVEDHAIAFARGSAAVIDALLRRHGGLEGWVLERNTRSMRWLAWLGFRLGEPFVLEPVGLVRRFEKWLL